MKETESEQRIALTKTQISILKRMFENVYENEFNTNLDLSDIPSEKLMDFWLYTTGFMCLQNYESDTIPFASTDCENVINGWFYLKSITYDEARKLLTESGNPPKNKNDFIGNLYTVQDGRYSIGVSKKVVYRNGVPLRNQPCIVLQTNKPVYVYYDNDVDVSPEDLIKMIRNALAHDIPFVKGSTISFRIPRTKDYIEVSKMWLRGFSEIFSQLKVLVDENEIVKVLQEELANKSIHLVNEKEVESAVSMTKSLFAENIQSNFFRVHNFIKARLKYESGFYQKSLDEKISTLAAILSHSQNHLAESYETILPSVVYSLQQIVARELAKREEKATFYLDNDESDEIFEMIERKDKAVESYDNYLKKYPVLNNIRSNAFYTFQKRNPFVIKQFLKILDEIDKVEAILKQKLASIKTRQKLENSKMEFYNVDSLKFLPVEVASNIVWLMGYNSLITSAIYEDLLACTDLNDLNSEQDKFFSNFNLSKFTIGFMSNNQKIDGKQLTASGKAYMLVILRSAICHGRIKYNFPPVKKGERPNFNDVNLTFYDRDDIEISGKLIDFYNFFSNGAFVSKRMPSIITKISPDKNTDKNAATDEIDEEYLFGELGELDDETDAPDNLVNNSQPGDDDN